MRTRFLATLTLSKVFLDPVWYFYIFWFPQYLKSVRGFDLAEIGMTAWIPFVTADLGNLVGGWLTGRLIQRGVPTSTARKAVFGMFALLDDISHSGRACHEFVGFNCLDIGRDLWLHRLQQQRDCLSS